MAVAVELDTPLAINLPDINQIPQQIVFRFPFHIEVLTEQLNP